MGVRSGYKQTEVGVIPSDWHVKRLGEIGEALIGLTYKPTEVRDHGTLVLRSSNIQNDALAFDDNVFVHADIPDRIMVRPNDVLVCVRNGSRDLIGKSALLDERTKGMTFGAFMAVYRSPIGKLASCLFQSPILKRQISEHLGATINQITNKSLNAFLVPVPPSGAEQHAIAAALSDMDALLDGLTRLVAKKLDLKQATMQQLLTGQTRLPGFSGQWRAGNLANVISSLEAGVSVNSTDDIPTPGIPSVLKTSSLAGGVFLPSECKVIEARDLRRAQTSPKKDTILISRMNTPMLVGEIAYVDRDYEWLYLPDRVWMTEFKPDSLISAKWLAYLLTSRNYRSQLREIATGTSGSMKNISKSALLELPIQYPAPTEQIAIASVLSDMDAELAALETRLAKTRALKQAMMSELLTGKTRLPT